MLPAKFSATGRGCRNKGVESNLFLMGSVLNNFRVTPGSGLVGDKQAKHSKYSNHAPKYLLCPG